jgi:hypothetical protein
MERVAVTDAFSPLEPGTHSTEINSSRDSATISEQQRAALYTKIVDRTCSLERGIEPPMEDHSLIEEIHFETAQEFCHALAPFGPVFSKSVQDEIWVYRGHGSADYKLIPSAYREDGRKKLFEFSDCKTILEDAPDTSIRQMLIEVASVQQFFLTADEAGLPFPEDSQATRRILSKTVLHYKELVQDHKKIKDEKALLVDRYEWIPRELLSFVAIAQHHGIPTRLLDWSISPFVAAYFAATDALRHSTKRLSVHALLAKSPSRDPALDSLFEHVYASFALVTVPRAANPNLHAQEGIFSYLARRFEYPLMKPHLFVLDDALKLVERPAGNNGPLLYKFTLATEHAPEVLWYLDRMGYHAARMFPGFQGAAKAVFDRSHIRPPSAT